MAEILCRSDLLRPAPPAIRAGRGRGRSLVSYPRTSLKCSPLRTDFRGRRLAVFNPRSRPNGFNSSVQMSLCIGKAMKWWEKGLQSNMKAVVSTNDLAESLLGAGDRLVVLDFFSPGCGGCKALHPKICQIAEMNPDVMFLHVNYEEHKSMCYSLNVHVLPFFRFYRGAHGRVCSFSCTNATIKKFRDALAKHTTDRCSLGPTKGLEESELMALAANNELSFNYTRKTVPEHAHTPVSAPADKHLAPAGSRATEVSQEKALAPAGR